MRWDYIAPMRGSMHGGGIVLTRSVEAHVLVHHAASCWVLKLQSLFLDVVHFLFWVVLEELSFAPIIRISSKAVLTCERSALDHDCLQFPFDVCRGETFASLDEISLVANTLDGVNISA